MRGGGRERGTHARARVCVDMPYALTRCVVAVPRRALYRTGYLIRSGCARVRVPAWPFAMSVKSYGTVIRTSVPHGKMRSACVFPKERSPALAPGP